jgi:hypothetical protein
MTECHQSSFEFPACKSRKIHIDFNGGEVTSDADGLLVRQADRKLRLTEEIHRLLSAPRRQASCDHHQVELLRQRIYSFSGCACGDEAAESRRIASSNARLNSSG